jgi:Lipocalin-like domain
MCANPLVGTWRLVSVEVRDEDGGIAHPLGRNVVGSLTYAADGYMAAQIGRADRAPVTAGDWFAAPDTEVTAAARDYVAYCGTYEFRGDAVVHRVELSLMPNWIGGEQVRLVALNGDALTLSTPPMPIGGRQQTATLVWQRARNTEVVKHTSP